MAARTGMTAVISLMRQYGQAATDDVFDGVTYWTDNQLQTIADRNGTRGLITIKRVDPAYKVYRLNAPQSIMMENDLVVYDENTLVTTPFTYNPDTNELTFTAALTYDTYQVYGLAIETNDALATLWQAKADQRFNYIDWKAQNNKMNMAQEFQHCVERAIYYRNKRVRTFDRKGRGKWYQ